MRAFAACVRQLAGEGPRAGELVTLLQTKGSGGIAVEGGVTLQRVEEER
jgi:hypothetical protein